MSEVITVLTPSHTIARWQAQGWLRAIDAHLYTLLRREGVSEPVAALAALASYQVGRGHTCLSVPALLASPRLTLGLEEEWPEFEQAFADLLPVAPDLSTSEAVHVQGQPETELRPLVWDAGYQLLYLRRYWQYEQRIAQWLQARKDPLEVPNAQRLRALIQDLMPAADTGVNWQRVACANAAKQRFSVITGGPGTGKTYTVVRVLATLLALNEHLSIALAAPTGKAAARMDASVAEALADSSQGPLGRVHSALTRKASTLHRLLGVQRHSRYFRHHQAQPLPYDVVVVDEASMIDTELFAALLDAIGPNTRLILLGDKDQLAPVEAGSILASLCRYAEQRQYSSAHGQWLMDATGEVLPQPAEGDADDHIVMLEGSVRFKGAIADLAQAVNGCDVQAAQTALASPQLQVVQSRREPQLWTEAERNALWQDLAKGFKPFVQLCKEQPAIEHADAWAAQVLAQFAQYQVLTALRAGPWGQQHINQAMSGLFATQSGLWYPGRPVMVTGNDYGLNLLNGDVGVTLVHPEDGRLRVVFPTPKTDLNPSGVRWILPSRLDAVETVYAMTVHKSQGSEFQHAVLVLPDRHTPVLTKELIYTGITRAKSDLTLVIPNQAVWVQGVQTRIERLGGLG